MPVIKSRMMDGTFFMVTDNSVGTEFAEMDIGKVTSADVLKLLKSIMNHKVHSEYLFYASEYGRLKLYFSVKH